MSDENSDKAIAPDVDAQMTVGELKEELEDVPDYAGVTVMACGAVGFATDAKLTIDGFKISE